MNTPRSRRLAIGLVVALLLLISAGPAAADGGDTSATAAVSLAATFAGNELTIVIRPVQQVPSPLYVDVVAHNPVRPETLALTALPLDGSGASASGSVRFSAAGMYSTSLRVDHAGPWELDLGAAGQRARLPFRVLVPALSPWERIAYPGFALTGVFLLSALITFALGRRTAAIAQSALAVIALAVGLTAALLSGAMPVALPQGAQPLPGYSALNGASYITATGSTALGRPYANLGLATTPAAPVAGAEFTLRLRLIDGATGLPVDDLVPMDGALAHLVVTSQDLSFFTHIHPVPAVAGELDVSLAVPKPGSYLAQLEFARANSGAQLVTGSFTVGGGAAADPVSVAPSGTSVSTTPAEPVAGVPTEIDLRVSQDGQGVHDIQPWLGMAGHLLVRDSWDDFFGHAHEMSSLMLMSEPGVPIPDETVASYGPVLRFLFTFPVPGRYSVWIQYERNFTIYTVPVTLRVGSS